MALAVLLGALVGLDRELSDKPAGLRTHALVGLGAALFALVPLRLVEPGSPLDVSGLSRVVQGVVAGVGFIGGGVILHRQGGKQVHGLTTAASIWLAAALGIATALGLWRTALVAVVFALVLLSGGSRLETALHRWVARRRAGQDRSD